MSKRPIELLLNKKSPLEEGVVAMCNPKHSRIGAKGPPLVGEEVCKRVGT